jgi:hypothetical protein
MTERVLCAGSRGSGTRPSGAIPQSLPSRRRRAGFDLAISGDGGATGAICSAFLVDE